jgi:hypothetical protein
MSVSLTYPDRGRRRCYKGYASSYAATEPSIGRDAPSTGRGPYPARGFLYWPRPRVSTHVRRYDKARNRAEPRWETVWSRVKLHLVWDRQLQPEEPEAQLYASWKYPRWVEEVYIIFL